MTGTERKGKRSAFPPGAAQGCPTAAPAALCGVRVAVPLGSVRGSRRALRGANWGYTCDGCGNFANVLNRLPWLCVAGCRHRGARSGRGDGYTIHRAALAVQWVTVWRCARVCPVATQAGRRRVWRRESPRRSRVVTRRAGMGGTGRLSKIDPASDFCSETGKSGSCRDPLGPVCEALVRWNAGLSLSGLLTTSATGLAIAVTSPRGGGAARYVPLALVR